jgi:hypothetical protein
MMRYHRFGTIDKQTLIGKALIKIECKAAL